MLLSVGPVSINDLCPRAQRPEALRRINDHHVHHGQDHQTQPPSIALNHVHNRRRPQRLSWRIPFSRYYKAQIAPLSIPPLSTTTFLDQASLRQVAFSSQGGASGFASSNRRTCFTSAAKRFTIDDSMAARQPSAHKVVAIGKTIDQAA